MNFTLKESRKVLEEVPIIDIGPLFSKTNSKIDKEDLLLTKEIGLACRQWGFFYIKNHNISQATIDDITAQAQAFFKQSKQDKNLVARFQGNFQGYSDNELTKQKLDLKEIFDYSLDSSGKTDVWYGHNQWPSKLPVFQRSALNYFKEMQELSRILMRVIFANLIEKTDEFVTSCFASGGDTSFARLNFYAPLPPEKEMGNQLGVGPHSDAGILTILYQQLGVSSLQVWNNGEFHDVPPIEDTFVINIGDMTEVFSNGEYSAPVHRVLASSSKSRLSIPFFFNPSYSCIVEPLPSKQNPKFRPIEWGQFRLGRILGDYSDLGEELQISHYRI